MECSEGCDSCAALRVSAEGCEGLRAERCAGISNWAKALLHFERVRERSWKWSLRLFARVDCEWLALYGVVVSGVPEEMMGMIFVFSGLRDGGGDAVIRACSAVTLAGL